MVHAQRHDRRMVAGWTLSVFFLLAVSPDARAAPGRVSRILLNDGNYRGMHPYKAVFDRKRNAYYIACSGTGTEILRFDLRTRSLKRVFQFKGGVKNLLYDATTDRLFLLSTYIKLWVLDVNANFKVVRKWRAGGRPQQMVFDPAARRLYVTAGHYAGRDAVARALFVFKLGKRRPIKRIKLRRFRYAPTFMALDRARKRLYVASHRRSILRHIPRKQPAGHLAVIDTRRLRVKRIVKLAINPDKMIYDARNRRLLFTDFVGQLRTSRRTPRHVVNRAWRKAMVERCTLTLVQLPRATIRSFVFRPHVPPSRLHAGYYEPRDGTVNLLFKKRQDFQLIKARTTSTGLQVVHRRWIRNLGSGAGYMDPGPRANQALVLLSRLRLLAIADFNRPRTVFRPTGYRIKDLAVNRKKGLVYALDGNAGQLIVINARTGKVIRRPKVPRRSTRLIVSEPLNLVAVVADHKMPGMIRGSKITKSLSVYNPAVTRRVFFKTFRATRYRYAKIKSPVFDVRRRTLYLVFDDHVQVFNLKTGRHHRFKTPFRDVRGVVFDKRRSRLLVVERLRKLALYNVAPLRLVRRSVIDWRACKTNASNRYFGGFDLCEVIYRVWPHYDYRRFFPRLLPIKYPDNFFLDRARRRVMVWDHGLNSFLNKLHVVPLKNFALGPVKQISYLVSSGPQRGRSDYITRKTMYAFDARNRVVVQVGTGQFKRRCRPKDCSKVFNYAYAFRLDDPRNSFTLRSIATLRDNPSKVVLVPRNRTAYISHVFGSYITRVKY